MTSSILDTILEDAWQTKFRLVIERLSFFSVNFVVSLIILVLAYPLSQEILSPLLSSVIPISHTSLPKAMLIMTVMYWAPIVFDTVKRWHRNEL